MGIEAGDDVYVDDGTGIVAHVRRASLREIVFFVEDQGDITLPRDVVIKAANNAVLLACAKLPLKFRAMIGHLHGKAFDEEA
jgi:hypothetical protein